MSTPERRAYWEAKYGGRERMWSGQPNAQLADVAAALPPGAALDLGCGEGADAVWLAERGWSVTAVDISPTALARGARAAADRGLAADRIAWVEADLVEWAPDATYDLVTASFLHAPDDFPRIDVLRRAAAATAPGGALVLVTHAEPPPWRRSADADAADHRRAQPDDDVRDLGLDGPDWRVDVAEVRERTATSPDGEPAVLRDGVIVARRA